ncbi:uncharacterized protein LOC130672467 [Microplitis mediator]|uniref:uncharacterized protein LOC130672467 n=1 Tax=Microplitis mediator TaxID=375433 RepID=UPI00255258C4|nr:uncharacterized protein LOC130672467 [Microplitis mediator]
MKSIVLLLAFAGVAVSKDIFAAVKVISDNPTVHVNGVLRLEQRGYGPVRLTGTITGLTPGKHGFHVHETGNITYGCMSAGGHYNPTNRRHGAPTDFERHVGDLGNIVANAYGVAKIYIVDRVISLTGPYSILGRAIVVHSGEDDLGRGGNEGSLINGNSGKPVGCGVIGIAAGP